METIVIIAVVIVAVVGVFVIRNGMRNNDPLNRKAAAEVCVYLTSPGGQSDPLEIAAILSANARYRSHAKHIASMVPVLLENAGVPWEIAKSAQPTVLAAAQLLPK